MNIARILRSLGEMEELAETIGRSQKSNQPLLPGTVQMWGKNLDAHCAEIREEIGRHPVAKDATQPVVAGNRN